MPDDDVQVDPVTGEEVIDLETARKDELVEEAEARGLDTSGTKAELADRIVDADESGGTSFNYGPEAATGDEEFVSAEDAPGGKDFSYGPEAVE